MEERRSLLNTYLPMLVAVALTGLSAYISAKIQISQLEERLTDAQERTKTLTEIVLANTKMVSELKGRVSCEYE